jgi:hypothetical protein
MTNINKDNDDDKLIFQKMEIIISSIKHIDYF